MTIIKPGHAWPTYVPSREGRIYPEVAENLQDTPPDEQGKLALAVLMVLTGAREPDDYIGDFDFRDIRWLRTLADQSDIAENRKNYNSERGKKGGRPSSVNPADVARLAAEGLTNAQIAAELKVSRSTIERAKATYRQNQKNPQNLPQNHIKSNILKNKKGYDGAGVACDAPAPAISEETENWVTPEELDALLAAQAQNKEVRS